ncbi:MAG: enoyl-CoA hydratase/isomerase family protein [Pseudomonadota bacterium]
MADARDIVFSREGHAGRILLNRPQALNALTHAMCQVLRARLAAWAAEDDVKTVVIEGAGEKAFCAGGDVIALYESGKAGTPAWERFFADEYRMNAAIGAFAKPYVALLDGIVMGGGVGVSVHGGYRVATERTLFSMPETGIGLIPDVGGGHFMPRLPGLSGLYLALTGARLGPADCMLLGIATHYVPSHRLPDLKAALDGDADVAAVLGDFHEDPGTPSLTAARLAEINVCFGGASVEAIGQALAKGSDWARKTGESMARLSPTSLKLTLRQMRMGATLDLRATLRMEYRIVSHIKAGHDFFEGVRALLIDKDKQPRWRPARLEDVDDAMVARYFTEPAWGDLRFDD